MIRRGIRCAALVAVLMPVAAGAADATNGRGKRTDRKAVCAVRGTLERLRVDCRKASVAELLKALHKSVGLKSEYPRDLAAAPVSVPLRHGTLHEVLGRALASFNFAVWTDQSLPPTTWVKIVGRRQSLDDGSQPLGHGSVVPATEVSGGSAAGGMTATAEAALLPEETGASRPPEMTYSEIPAKPSSLFPQQDEAEMARQRANFSQAIARTAPLKPPRADPGKVLWPSRTPPQLDENDLRARVGRWRRACALPSSLDR